MKKSILAFLVAAPMLLASCVRNNGLCYVHKDQNLDGICDICEAKVDIHVHTDKDHNHICDFEICELEGVDYTHYDEDKDGKCDFCGEKIGEHAHVDKNTDGKCDICGCDMEKPPKPIEPCADGKHVDENTDYICDICNADLQKGEHTHVDVDEDHKCDVCGAIMEICTNHYDGDHDGYCDYCHTKMDIPGKVTVYLVLTTVGRYNGNVGMTVDSLYLENTITLEGTPGDPLPGKESVTHAYNSKAEFESWLCYEGKGAPTVYTVFPSETNKILYANFVANGYDPTPGPTPDPTPDPVDMKTYYLRTNFVDGSGDWTVGGEKFYVWAWSATNSGQAYDVTYVSASYYSFSIPSNTTGILFARVPESSTSFSWETTVWNKTENLDVVAGKTTAQITCWHVDGGGEGFPSGVIWAE